MSDDTTTFRVEFVTGEAVDMEFEADAAASLRDLLPQATTIVGCPDCGDLAPITGGIPQREMPPCARCDEAMTGVTDVHEIEQEGGNNE